MTTQEIDDVISQRRRRSDLTVWNGQVCYLENLGSGGQSVLVRHGDVVAEVISTTGVASSLNGYGSPCWAPIDSNRAVILRADGGGVDLIDTHGTTLRNVELPAALAAGYLRRRRDGFVVLVDYGPEIGRALLHYELSGTLAEIYRTRNLMGDVVLSEDGETVAWLEWSSDSMPWESARLAISSFAKSLDPRFVNSGDTAASQPTFVGRDLYFSLEVDEWTVPSRLRGPEFGEVSTLDAPMAEYRSDWCFGRQWTAGVSDGVLMCSVRESLSHVTWLREKRPSVELADSPEYIYEICSSPDGVVALVSTAQESGALWSFSETSMKWTSREFSPPRGTTSSATHRRTNSGVPFIWRAPPAKASEVASLGLTGVVVTAHGGPTGYSSMGYDPFFELLTRCGLAVASVNYRGSSSYGRSYRRALNSHWAEADVHDVESVIEYLVSSGDVDPSRVFVRGTSAGALSALLASCNERVCGVVAIGSVTDLRFLATHTLEFETSYVSTLLGSALFDDQKYQQRSPLQRVDELCSRALLIHGDRDEVSPIEPVQRLAAAWAERSSQVELIVMSGEGHSFRQPANQLRAIQRELEFYQDV